MNLDSFPQETSWSSVSQNFLLRDRHLLSVGLLVSDQSHRTLDESLIGKLLYCCLLAEPTSLFKKKQKKWEKNIALEIRPSRTNWPLVKPNPDHGPDYKDYDQTFQTELTSDQTEPRPWSRLKRLWSDLPDRIDLWSDRTQTMVQIKKNMIRPSRPNWLLIRPKSDHGPDYCALEPLSRPCNFGLGTQGCALDWVWS